MSGIDDFIRSMGPPAPSAPPLRFRNDWAQDVWETIHEKVGSGWFERRFFYLFGTGMDPFRMCTNAWSFLVPYDPKQMIVGRNAYGALLVLENPDEPGPTSRVRILNPLELMWWADPDVDFIGLIGYWFPNRALPPSFLDTSVYDAWRAESGRDIAFDEVLGIRVPLALGGKMELDNFHVENIVKYYEGTAPIYGKAFARMGKASCE